MVAAAIGSPRRLEYTVIGDAVNTVVRLEEATKTLGTEVVVSDATVAKLASSELLKRWGIVSLRGRQDPIEATRWKGP